MSVFIISLLYFQTGLSVMLLLYFHCSRLSPPLRSLPCSLWFTIHMFFGLLLVFRRFVCFVFSLRVSVLLGAIGRILDGCWS